MEGALEANMDQHLNMGLRDGILISSNQIYGNKRLCEPKTNKSGSKSIKGLDNEYLLVEPKHVCDIEIELELKLEPN